MILLLRIFLIGLIFYLILNSFSKYAGKSDGSFNNREKDSNNKRISKETGEYVDYEEIKK
jgi:hypothetical protein